MLRTLTLLSLSLALTACATQPSATNLAALSGVDMYQQLCASCHGVAGRGDGPVAPLIKVGVTDLTRIAARDGGEFPTEDVRRIIDGRNDRRAHGPRDMPVWGWQLYDESGSADPEARARTNALIDRLVVYLQSIQRP